MKKEIQSYLRQIYQYDETDKTFLVSISLNSYEEILNDWDAGPVRKKSMNPELDSFLEEALHEIPIKQKTKIVFMIPEKIKDPQKEVMHIEAFKNYYRALIHFLNRDLKTIYRKMMIYIILGFLFIIVSTLLSHYFPDNLLGEILSQGIFIGGWVLIWESFSLFFFESYDKRDLRKRYIRFINNKIIYRYTK
ncbi:MAG: hypothetical protein WCR19_03280 [Acholeplasmataceae bacterium]